jgi:hypothetical protein
MGEYFGPNAVPLSHGLEEIGRHSPNCYFCLNNITGVNPKSKHTVKYQDLPSLMKPFPHRYEFSVPNRPENQTFSYDKSDSGEDHEQREC